MKKRIYQQPNASQSFIAGLGLFMVLMCICILVQKLSTRDVSGKWRLYLKSDSNSFCAGKTDTQQVIFTQKDKIVNGQGEKLQKDTKPLTLRYTGCVDGNILKADYLVVKEKQSCMGDIFMEISPDGKKMEGVFSASTEELRGKVSGERIE